ncbi:MAG: hypothetical protein JJT75_09420 [Opitutales bacterium]|nr:hypothetical protein [Opitutales bacterium]MCH8539905.1 hypothetical protein [Opitutales bacterium]
MNINSVKVFLKEYFLVSIMVPLIVALAVMTWLRLGEIATLTELTEETDTQIEQMERNIQRGQGIEDDLETLRQFPEMVKDRLLVFQQFDPIEAVRDRQRITRQINRLVENSLGRAPSNLRMIPGSLENMENYREIGFAIIVEATLDELYSLALDLEDAEPLIRLDSFQLRNDNGDNATRHIEASLRFQVLAARPFEESSE